MFVKLLKLIKGGDKAKSQDAVRLKNIVSQGT
jgi:hypothetical protein